MIMFHNEYVCDYEESCMTGGKRLQTCRNIMQKSFFVLKSQNTYDTLMITQFMSIVVFFLIIIIKHRIKT